MKKNLQNLKGIYKTLDKSRGTSDMKERKDELKLNAATPNMVNNDYAYARMSEN